MKVFVVLSAILAVAIAQNYPVDESPKPYSFNYVAEGDEGSSSHSETADGSGTVRGSYSLTDMDGRNRVVEYVAGPEGFNAVVRTNEPGTDNAAPADVTMESSGDKSQFYSAPQTRPAQSRPVSYSAPQTRPVSPRQGGAGRYILVPSDDPRTRTYSQS